MEMEKKKEPYEEPKAEVILFEHEDIITTSGGGVVSTPKDEFDDWWS